jgi:L-2-hydroxyglutarate oxidase LhgO
MIIIVGSGIIGSWIAYTFAKAGEEVYVFEKSKNAGDGISGRNSDVLHSGIYYDSGSLKSKMCFQGYEIAIPFFEENQIPYSLCGKVITTGVSETIQEETEKQETIQKLFENGKSLCIPQIELKSNPNQHWKHILGSTALGVHYTFHLGGEAYAGPNSNWASSKEDYKMQTPRGEYYQSFRKILD